MEIIQKNLQGNNRKVLDRSMIVHDKEFELYANRSGSKENAFNVVSLKIRPNKSIDRAPEALLQMCSQNVVKKRNPSLQKPLPPHSKATGKKSSKKKPKIQSPQVEETRQQQPQLLEEDLRIQELNLKLQEQLAAEEERQRLESQREYEEQLLLQFESNVYFSEQKRNQTQSWQRYIDCISKPDPESSPEITGFIYLYDEINQINDLEIISYLDRIVYSESVVDDLYNCYLKARGDNNPQKQINSVQFIAQLRSITNKKIDEITSFLIKNQQTFVNEKNTYLLKKNLLPLKSENLDEISRSIQRKQEERYEYEIIKQYQNDNVKLGLSFNLIKRLGQRHRPVHFPQFNVQVDLPRVFQTNSSVFRYSFIKQDYLEQSSVFILGGVHKLDCYEALSFPTSGKGWLMQKDFNNIQEVLKKIKQVDENSLQLPQNLSISLQLSKEIYLGEADSIQIVSLNDNRWSSEKITLESFDKTSYTAKFLTPRLDYFAFSQSRMVDFCYNNWVIRSVDSNQAYLDIETKRLTLRFQISENHVTLLNNDIPQLQHLVDKMLEGSMLLFQLLKVGINLLPQMQDAVFLKCEKTIEVENKALLELMLAVKSYTIRQSKQNKGASDKIIFQICENNNYSKSIPDDQSDWKTISIWSNKCALLSQDQKLMPGTSTQAMIELLLSEHQLAPPELIYRMQSLACSDFQNNIRRFFKLTGLLIYS